MKFGTQEDVSNLKCGTNIEKEMGCDLLGSSLLEFINVRDTQPSDKKIIGYFDSDKTPKDKAKLTDRNNIYSVTLNLANSSTEHLFEHSDLYKKYGSLRLFNGLEFDKESKKLTSPKLGKSIRSINLGGKSDNINKAGRDVIIDDDVFNNKGKVSLNKEVFATAVYEGKIKISDASWEKFRPIFQIIQSIISSSKSE